MDLETYDGLVEAIADVLMRDDLANQIPLFIRLAESNIARDLRVADMEEIAVSEMVDGEVALPNDFLEVINIVGEGAYNTPWEQITPSKAALQYGTTASGPLRHYTITGSVLTSYPNGGDGDVTLVYYARPPALTVGNQSNWLLLKAPDVYLWGSCKASAPWLEADERLQTWEGLYQQAVSNLRKSDELHGGTLISRVEGIP